MNVRSTAAAPASVAPWSTVVAGRRRRGHGLSQHIGSRAPSHRPLAPPARPPPAGPGCAGGVSSRSPVRSATSPVATGPCSTRPRTPAAGAGRRGAPAAMPTAPTHGHGSASPPHGGGQLDAASGGRLPVRRRERRLSMARRVVDVLRPLRGGERQPGVTHADGGPRLAGPLEQDGRPLVGVGRVGADGDAVQQDLELAQVGLGPARLTRLVPASVQPSMLGRGTGMGSRRQAAGSPGGGGREPWHPPRVRGSVARSMRRSRTFPPGTCTVRYMPAYDDDLRLAHVLADAADSTTMTRFRAQDLRVESKPDLTPVTDADRSGRGGHPLHPQAGAAARRDHGEEYGESGHGPRRWVLDPIDGTKNFVRGVPVWATLIALMDGDVTSSPAWCSAPALGRRWWAARRAPVPTPARAWRRRAGWRSRRSRTSTDASLSYSSLPGLGGPRLRRSRSST